MARAHLKAVDLLPASDLYRQLAVRIMPARDATGMGTPEANPDREQRARPERARAFPTHAVRGSVGVAQCTNGATPALTSTRESGGTVDTQDPYPAHGGSDSSRRASLRLELRVPDRRLLAAFRDAFLRWLNDRAGPFARVMGASEKVSLDEVPPSDDPQGMSTLRLTVSWPLSQTALTGALFHVDSNAGSPPARLPPVDRFVFFPDPPDATAPLFQRLTVPLPANVFQPPPRLPQLRVSGPISDTLAKNVVEALKEVRAFAGACSRRLGIAGMTIRVPLAGSYPRAWAISLVGTAAVTAGFVAGSIYLATMDRTRVEPDLSTSAAPVAEPAALSVPMAMPLKVDLARATRVEPPVVVRAPVAPPPAEVAVSTNGSNGIADAEVTTGRSRSIAGRPTTLRRPEVVVVRAVEGAGSAVTVSAAESRRVKGALLVRSEPQGAEVSINGVVHGRTPLMIRDLGAGSRVLRLDLPGYKRWSWAVAVVANKRTPVTVKLQPELRGVSNPD
jgi:hypothetical protein